MKSLEESVVIAMDTTDTAIFPYLPYILQDFWEIGTSPKEVITLLERQKLNHAQLDVLDLGCGKGAVSIGLADKLRHHCLGIDGIEEFISEANSAAKEHAVDTLCEFRVGDIRKEIKDLGKYDIIILGAIGQVFGNYYETLTTMLPHLKDSGVIIIDDGYIENNDEVSQSSILNKEELLYQVEEAGMVICDEIKAGQEVFDNNEEDLRLLVQRCEELKVKYPEKTSLFQSYIENQRKEYTTLEQDIICSIMLIKRNVIA
ncbi:class I SAM-dependent methyltransferase [uncultured Dysgonomonas sp.]|uniref:Methyltransferase type 12 n=1 Tax=uncultured Dysgonomonas sp. TaxID=206096 RepID=A0A212JFS0_9BACT|nr:class I SAM-dependent methyltransferase [uncultured Dysgonomonas sp.]SBV98251.1 Methyltransferase type 12 [uncultured Dysgonomonas sp.]